jgi:hypothetical protein
VARVVVLPGLRAGGGRVIDIFIIAGSSCLAAALGWYLRGREERKLRGLYVLFAIPRDDVDIDIPRREDTRRMPC